jgi:hypothetical protein
LAAAAAVLAFIVYQFATDLHRGVEVSWATTCSTAPAKFVCTAQDQAGVGWFVLPSVVLLGAVVVARTERGHRLGVAARLVAYVAAAAAGLWTLAVLANLFLVPGVWFLPSGVLAVRCAYLLAAEPRPPTK